MKRLLVLMFVVVITVTEGFVRSVDNEIGSDSPTVGKSSTVNDFIKKVMSKKCLHQMSSTCLKLGLVRIVEQISTDSYYQLLPGVSLSTNSTEAIQQLLPELTGREDRTLQQRIDYYLIHRVSSYLKSLTLHIKLVDVGLHQNASQSTDAYSVLDVVTGRRNKGANNNGMLAMGLMFAGTMLALALSGLAALAGKAMMTALLSLMLSAMSAMKGGGHGGGGKSTTYEIIHKPEVSHAHTHSSELQYDHHGGHMYKRSLYP